jgi:4-hydroxybenzoate polyprenyltransferase
VSAAERRRIKARSGPLSTALVRASHPQPTLAVTALTTTLAAFTGRGLAGCALVAVTVLCGQLSVGWCNDTVDRDRDRATGRSDKPVALGLVSARTSGAASAIALAACVPLSLANGTLAGTVHLAAVASAWGYDLGIKRTLASWAPYALSFGLLPAFVTLGLPGHPLPPAWATVAAMLLGVGAHLANTLPDLDGDLATGVLGLPQRLGRGPARLLAAATLVAASAVLALGPPGPPGAIGTGGLLLATLVATVAIAAPSRERTRVPFLAAIGVAAIDVALLLLRGSALA